MARKTLETRQATSQSNAPHRLPDDPQDVEAAIKRLEEHYRTGKDSLAESEDRAPYGTSSERLRKARVFAVRYTENDLKELVKKCRTHQMALGRTFIDRLATVGDKRKRRGLETRLIRERWSLRTLEREILGRFGRRRRLGRTPYPPTTRADALSELTRLSLKVTRWGETMDLIDNTGRIKTDPDNEVVALLPDGVVEKLNVALRAVWELQEAAEAELGE